MKILILGATGAAGSSLLELSLASPLVSQVTTLSRQPIATGSSKHVIFIHDDLLNYAKVSDAFAAIDHCFFCIGRAVSLVKDEEEYRRIALLAPQAAAREYFNRSPQGTFHYLSGGGADLRSRYMWARVKAEAEQALLKNYRVICWRPGAIDAKQTRGWPLHYKIVVPILRTIAPSKKFYVNGLDLAAAMLQVAAHGSAETIVENPRIRELAEAYRTRKSE